MTKHLTSTQLSVLRFAARDVTRLTSHLDDEMLGELYAAVKAERDERSCFNDDDICYAPLYEESSYYDTNEESNLDWNQKRGDQ